MKSGRCRVKRGKEFRAPNFPPRNFPVPGAAKRRGRTASVNPVACASPKERVGWDRASLLAPTPHLPGYRCARLRDTTATPRLEPPNNLMLQSNYLVVV